MCGTWNSWGCIHRSNAGFNNSRVSASFPRRIVLCLVSWAVEVGSSFRSRALFEIILQRQTDINNETGQRFYGPGVLSIFLPAFYVPVVTWSSVLFRCVVLPSAPLPIIDISLWYSAEVCSLNEKKGPVIVIVCYVGLFRW